MSKLALSQRFVSCLSTCLILFCLLSCTNSTPSIEKSGDADVDKTAVYAAHLVGIVKKRSGMDTPSKIVSYIFSTAGSAELTPPSLEFESDMAEYYKGPKKAPNVGLSAGPELKNFFEKEILLTPNDADKSILVEAFRGDSEEPFHTWKWKL